MYLIYIVYKFGEIRFCTPGVYVVRICTVGVDHFTEISLAKFARGRHCWALRWSVIGFVSLIFAPTLRCRAGYTLASATHFWCVLDVMPTAASGVRCKPVFNELQIDRIRPEDDVINMTCRATSRGLFHRWVYLSRAIQVSGPGDTWARSIAGGSEVLLSRTVRGLW